MSIEDIFGKPNIGIHSTRFLGMAFWDLFITFIVAIPIGLKFHKNVFVVFIGLFFLGTVIHLALGVNTAFSKVVKSLFC